MKNNKKSFHYPLVSIVIPTYNQGKYLPACVDHCLFQTWPNLEIIIVDGGSCDNTKEFLAQLKEKIKTTTIEPVSAMDNDGEIIREIQLSYPQNRRIELVIFDKDIGATRTYNEGFKRAKGKYCSYIVGDDLPHPHMIEELATFLEASPDIDFVYSDMNLVDDQNQIIRQIRLPDYDFEESLAKWFHLGVSKLYRKEIQNEVGLMDEEYHSANDYDHYLRFAIGGCRFYHLSRILYSIRYHGPTRKTGQHTPTRYLNLLEESKRCAARARKFK
jgi:glycosyltransferase involved in cell wall biosynthesis